MLGEGPRAGGRVRFYQRIAGSLTTIVCAASALRSFDTGAYARLRWPGTHMSTERAPRNVTTERRFRDALAQFATGVTIITARAQEGGFVGFTATSFNSVSLEPPLVIWSLGRRSRSLPAFERAERYAVNVLAHDQAELAQRFSRPHTDRFAGVNYRLGEAAAP